MRQTSAPRDRAAPHAVPRARSTEPRQRRLGLGRQLARGVELVGAAAEAEDERKELANEDVPDDRGEDLTKLAREGLDDEGLDEVCIVS